MWSVSAGVGLEEWVQTDRLRVKDLDEEFFAHAFPPPPYQYGPCRRCAFNLCLALRLASGDTVKPVRGGTVGRAGEGVGSRLVLRTMCL